MGENYVTILGRKIEEFKKLFAAAPRLLDAGQFQVMAATKNEIGKQVQDELRAAGLGVERDPITVGVIDFFKSPVDDKTPVRAARLRALINGSPYKEALPKTLHMLGHDGSATKHWAAAPYSAVWTTSGIVPTPSIGGPLTVDHIVSAWHYEKGKCGDTVASMAKKVLLAQGVSLTPNPANPETQRIANARYVPMGARQIVVYDPKLLAEVVVKIGSALDDGYLYRFGVQSGMRHEMKAPWPTPEHYLLIFAHFESRIFIFWDPDSATSNSDWGLGFGAMWYRDDRLSTAVSEEDFRDVSNNFHNQFPIRHLYQVNAIKPLS